MPTRQAEFASVNIQIAERVRAARIAAKLRQADVARLVGLTPGAISHFEVGRREWTVPLLIAVARAIGVDPACLMPSSAVTLSTAEAAMVTAARRNDAVGLMEAVTAILRKG